jgi:DNA-binding transcriptional ArsR family regulator
MPDPAPTSITASAPIFAALGDSTRLWLVTRLCEGGPSSISELSVGAEVTRQAVTKHLQVLANAGLVRAARQGREMVYELTPAQLEQARSYLDQISERWDRALRRLRTLVEE